MKRNIKIAAFVIGIMALAITGCKKDCMDNNLIKQDVFSSDIQALAVQAETESDIPEIIYNESTNEMTAVNEGIATDYLATVEDFDACQNTVSGANTSTGTSIGSKSFLHCLKDLKLSDDQIKKIRIAMGEYHDCKASTIHRARAIHAALVAKYKDLAHEQAKLLRDGKINKTEYDARIARLRHAFQKELRDLQLKQKVNEALKNCHVKFLRQLNGILTERQWKAFVACHKK